MISIWRILIYGIQGFRRNIWLSVIAIITMTLTLTTITVFLLGDLVATRQYQEFNKKIDYIIFLRDSAPDADVDALVQQVAARSEVSSSIFQSKEDIRKKFEARFQSVEALKGIVTSENNPLPREIDVKFKDPRQIDTFDSFIRDPRYEEIIESTSYQNNKSAIDNYVRSTNVLKVFGLFFTGFFVLISLIVILNTIRLAIFSRRDEIEIMRLVGATRSYIRGPFLVEGILFGVLGALLSAVLFWGLLRQLQIVLQDSIRFGTSNFINDLFSSSLGSITNASGFNTVFSQLVGIQLVVGVALGIFCSFVAARRYLRE